MPIWEFRRPRPLLVMSRQDWRRLIIELRQRGRAGGRESGAFLLGKRGSSRSTVTRVVYLDDLDPHCLNGGISLDGLAYSKLWDLCEKEGMVVVGDVHTHPGAGVRQSAIDADNPMVSQRGHVALIVPHLAMREVTPSDVGVHEYRGEDGWITWLGKHAAKRLVLKHP